MKWTIGPALIGALAFSTSSWAGDSGLRIVIQATANENTNANGAVVFGSGNSANFNSSKSSSCAGICVNGNTISGGQHQYKPKNPS
jgi:hypothetical protein